MDVESLGAALGSTYRIERELAPGGMSRVFLAEELALGRLVVIKTLSPDLAAGVSADRFTREIQLAARLQQANIVPLLGFGLVDGLPYYTMPYVDGESLRNRLTSDGPPSVSRSLGILRDVARALTYAHEHGIVHRDIKPENVLLSGDAAVVTDFGIAKAVNRSLDSGNQSLTITGAVVGTPAYIAPEQAAGDPDTDHRADFYSFGCIAYELFTGNAPFFGRSPQAILAAHMTEVPKAIETLAAEVPRNVSDLIARCLKKSPADRPQSGREILEVLDAVPTGESSRSARAHFVDWRIAAAAVAVIALVIALYIARRESQTARAPRQPRAKAVAVLPFTNASGDSSEAYFAEGMADELIAALGKVPVLSVASRHSAFALKQRNDLDIQAIGQRLHVDAILEGTVRRAGNRLRVTAQLTNTSDGLTLWSESYEREMKDVFAVQDDITQSIVGALRLRLGGDQRRVTSDIGAYDDYLRGAYALEQRGVGVARAVDLFNSAIRKDSSFARAYGKLSEALELLPYFSDVSAASVEQSAITAANRALALDSTAAEAHIGLALAMGHAYRFTDADREFRLAIAADSNSAVARTQYGRHLLSVARIPEAIEQFRKAVALDPLSGTQAAWLAHSYGMNGDIKRAINEGLKVHNQFPELENARVMPAFDLLSVSRNEEARRLVDPLPTSRSFLGLFCYVIGRSGDRQAALEIVRKLRVSPSTTWLVHSSLAYCHLGLDERDEFFDEADRAFRAREIMQKQEPFGDAIFDKVRPDPRFSVMVKKFGLDEKLFIPPNRGRPGK